MENQPENQHAELQAYINALPIEYSATFIPQSQSRNAKTKEPSLNWKIRIARSGSNALLETDYMQGIGHAPHYQECGETRKMYAHEYFKKMTETGKYNALKRRLSNGKTDWYETFNTSFPKITPLPAPKLIDVLYCLVLDASVLDAGTFEDWANEYGYDSDSIKARTMYDTCIKTAIELRGLIGQSAIDKLQTLFQDY